MQKLLRIAVLFLAAGCSAGQLADAPRDLGDFKLGHSVVVADNTSSIPLSRRASEEELMLSLDQAIDERFGDYSGSQFYHIAVNVGGYMLAPPGIPILLSPKSALIAEVSVWDDTAGHKLTDHPKQFTVFEDTTLASFFAGSGHVRTKQEQLDGLSENLAQQIEAWLVEQHEGNDWFYRDDAEGLPASQESI